MGTYNSITINASADQVWSTLRDFNNMDWAAGIIESVENLNGKGGTEVGAQRRLNGAFYETLQSFDDDSRAFSYSIDEGPDAMAKDRMSGYIGKARVAPITATGQSFVEWSSDWEAGGGAVHDMCDPLYKGLLGLLAAKFN